MDILNKHVLVLNKSWTAIGTTTVKEAVVLMSRDSARGFCTVNFISYTWEEWISEKTNLPQVEHYIRTPSLNVPAPEVIILTNYNDVHRTTVKFSSRAVYRRDSYTCVYCKKKCKTEDLTIDHVVPKSKGGKSSFENCVAACFTCNNLKGDSSLEDLGWTLGKKPSRPKWSPIIHVKDDLRPGSWKPLIKEDW